MLLAFWLTILATPQAHGATRGIPGQSMVAVPQPAPPPYDPSGPRVEYRIVLPDDMERALRAFDPSFKIWEQSDYSVKDIRRYPFSLQSTPSAVIGDFNGDGRLDAVLAGRNKHGPEILAVMSASATYRVVLVSRWNAFDTLRAKGKAVPKAAFGLLAFVPKGKAYDIGGDSVTRLFTFNNDGFICNQRTQYDDYRNWYGPSLYWWEGPASRFHVQDLDVEPGVLYP